MQLSKKEIKNNKEIFCAHLRNSIKPYHNVVELLRYLDENGFFKAPCSAGHHLACDGGLCKHSLSVMYMALHLQEEYNLPISVRSIIKCALLHDIHKMFLYQKVKGKWESKSRDKQHGRWALHIIRKFMHLTEQEEEMILWHMGPYTEYYDNHKPGDFLKWSNDKKNKNINAALFLYFCDHFSSMFLEDQ